MIRMRISTMALVVVTLACACLMALPTAADMVEPARNSNKHRHHDYRDSDDQHHTITLYPGDNDWCPDDVAAPVARNLRCPETMSLK
jgi:hypothetical protein